ncbi:MAG TPA: hypothetical protein VG318_17695 [Actinomycetota bacterium]|nr:hypothetical protein [Actinomycetota bacterium]
MLARYKRLVVGAVLAAVTVTAVPAGAWDGQVAAASPCRTDVGLRIEEWHQTVYVTGAYTAAGATDVSLTCGIVRYGETVARVGESEPGPVAVVVGSARVLGGPISICYEIKTVYLDRVAYSDTCP